MINILVIKSRNIGDVLLTAPLISSLKQQYPDSHITALVKQGTEAMLQGHPALEQVITFPTRGKNENKLAFLLQQASWWRKLRRQEFDIAINTTEGERGAITCRLSGAAKRIGLYNRKKSQRWHDFYYTQVKPQPTVQTHTVWRNLNLLDADIAPVTRVDLCVDKTDKIFVAELLTTLGQDHSKKLVQIHPTSRWFFKCWQDDKVAAVIDHLDNRQQAQVVLTSGPDQREIDKLNNIISQCTGDNIINLGGKLSLRQLAALTTECDMFFGVDTAPMHMAAALDIPVVALFGPSGTFDWGPWPNDWPERSNPYPHKNGIQKAGKHVVIQQAWDCAPCGKDGCDGSKKSRCLDEMNVATVIAQIDQKLDAL